MKLCFLLVTIFASQSFAKSSGINFKTTPLTGTVMLKEIGKEGFTPRSEIRGVCLIKKADRTTLPCRELELILLGPNRRQFPGRLDSKGSFVFTGLFKGSFNLWFRSPKYRLEKPVKNLYPGLSYSLIFEPSLK